MYVQKKWKFPFFILIFSAFFLSACGPNFIPIYNLNNNKISNELTNDQVKNAIKLGGVTSGWRIDEIEPGHMIGTFIIRGHVVIADIQYTTSSYGITYKNSKNMKIYCSEEDKEAGAPPMVSGRTNCKAVYIHEAYKIWIDDLNRSIQMSLNNSR